MAKLSPIARMIDATARCIICNATMADGCACWVTLKCPGCGRKRATQRTEADGDAKVVELACPECWYEHEIRGD